MLNILNAYATLIEDLSPMTYHKEDVFNDMLIPEGIIGGYNPGVEGFNVNSVEIYDQLCEYLTIKE